MSCQVIRDKKTGDSLQYAFIEFDKREDAEQVRESFIVPDLVHVYVPKNRLTSKCKTFSWTIVVYGLTCMCRNFLSSMYTDSMPSASSQSVARLNNKWSNNPAREDQAARRNARGGGGFGGRDDLEATRKYRDDDGGRNRSPSYEMVFEYPGVKRFIPEGTVTVTTGGRANVQGQGRLTKEGSVGAAEAGTWDDRVSRPQTAIGTVTDFVTGDANFRVPVQPRMPWQVILGPPPRVRPI